MSHRSVRLLIEDAAKSLGDSIQFGHGKRTEFNQKKKPEDPWIWLLPLNAIPRYTNNNSTENYEKQWNVIMVFLKMDRSDSLETEYNPILDDMDDLVDRFINRLNDWSMKATDTVGDLTIQNISQTNFIKSDADIYTGWFVSFQMIVSDDFEYCTPENVVIYGD